MIHDYVILSKHTGIHFQKYKNEVILLSDVIPKTVDELILQSKKNADKMCRIVTYRDKEGCVIEKSFEYPNNKLRQRVYTTSYLSIDDDEKVKSTIIHDYNISRNVFIATQKILKNYADLHIAKSSFWNLTQIITNHLSKNINAEENILSQVKITDLTTPTKQRHTFIEFPHLINGKISDTKKKLLSFVVNGRNYTVKKDYGIEQQGVKFPKNDSYLGFRALSINDIKEVITEKFIKERKLQRCMITIRANYYPQDEDEKLFAAHFDANDGSINFNKFCKTDSKTIVVGQAKHETEHGWQYFLRSRVEEPNTEWEAFINDKFGNIRSKKLLREAKRYAKSILNYVSLTKELFDSGNIQKYHDNYIEIKAKQAGEREKKKYDREAKSIRNSFKHIPKEYL